MKFSFYKYMVLIFLVPLIVFARGDRPRVGLVLSGGGAKGFAHIGVIKVLEELNIPIDYIAGTSMGSVVGGLYAAGLSIDELEQVAVGTDWNDILYDVVGRRKLRMDQKNWDGRYALKLPMRKAKIYLPSGIIAGQFVLEVLSRFTIPVHDVSDFSKLPVPFLALATDMQNGNGVRLDHGFLPYAIRASMSIPSVFVPMEIDGRYLIDGDRVRNIPVIDMIEKYHPDIIIAVDVSAVLFKKEELQSLLNVLNQSNMYSSVATNEAQLKLADIVIRPDISGLSPLSFDNVQDIVDRGERAARKVMPQLKALADSLRQYQPLPKHPVVSIPDSLDLDAVQIKGLRQVSWKTIISELNLRLPGRYSVDDIQQAVENIYSLQFFNRVDYRIHRENGKNILVLNIIEKKLNKFRLGFRYDNVRNTSFIINFLIRNLMRESSYINLDFLLGNRLEIDAQYYTLMGILPGVGLNLRLNYAEDNLDLYYQKEVLAQYGFRNYAGEVRFGSLFARIFDLDMGLRAEYVRASPNIGQVGLPKFEEKILTLMTVIWMDKYDRYYFPRNGYSIYARYDHGINYMGKMGEQISFDRVFFNASGAKEVYPGVVLGAHLVSGSVRRGEVPINGAFFLGGIDVPVLQTVRNRSLFSFYGLNLKELFGSNVHAGKFYIQYALSPKSFLIGAVNAGNVFDSWVDNVLDKGFIVGYGFTYGMDTILGPLEITVAGSEVHNFLTYFHLGVKF